MSSQTNKGQDWHGSQVYVTQRLSYLLYIIKRSINCYYLAYSSLRLFFSHRNINWVSCKSYLWTLIFKMFSTTVDTESSTREIFLNVST